MPTAPGDPLLMMMMMMVTMMSYKVYTYHVTQVTFTPFPLLRPFTLIPEREKMLQLSELDS